MTAIKGFRQVRMQRGHWIVVASCAAVLASACETASTGAPLGVDASFAFDAGGGADGGTLGVNECPAATGAGTTHPSTIPDETWTAAASPHILPYDTNVDGTLTLESCAIVKIAAGRTITVRGKIIASGIDRHPVTITRQDPLKAWSNIRALGGTMSLSYTLVEGGGDPLNTLPEFAAALDIRSDQTKPTQGILAVDHVVVTGSESQGLILRESGGFVAGSKSLQVTKSKSYAVSIWARHLSTLPPGDYTGNAIDEILIPANALSQDVTENVHIYDRGVPYHVGATSSSGELRVGTSPGNTVSTLTIDPGVVLKFKKGGNFTVEHFSGTTAASGALIAAGTAQKPIVFTSAEASPAAGDWLGLSFGSAPNPNNKLDYVQVKYAGGASSSGSSSCFVGETINNAAIRFFGTSAPASEFITNTTISDSAAHGIDRGWRDNPQTDFLVTNTFTNVARCKQTFPKDANGACPTTVPCP